MDKINSKTPPKTYWILILVSVLVGYLLFVVLKDEFSVQSLVFLSGIPFLLFVAGIFGLLWPKIKPTGDAIYITHALWVGLLFIVLFFIHVWIILPRMCPDFGACLGI
ncbi:hypothetical protein [Pseudozobellia thermophila]|uniref:Uncharacterized protein n=1 Tax=Pseudozobellia thermophila TaxID=192903 RepID=A0A1M6ENI2_9FLAO|nr:hypothetical protein [Pseudozobellia thermophila]SHI86898.1 hypothetical protein SAMN04488513_102118 [Pseudozobellia thermophila]